MKNTWKINEINEADLCELDREIGRNIRSLPHDHKELNRLANMASSKISLVRALVHAERILEVRSREFK